MMGIARAAGALAAAAALAGCGVFAGADPNAPHDVRVTVAPLADAPQGALGRRFGALTLTAARVLSADDPAFGGVSALEAEIDREGVLRLGLITDAADRIDGAAPMAAITDAASHAMDARVTPYRDAAGAALEGKQNADSEGIARLDDVTGEGGACAVVSFERRHRVSVFCGAAGSPADAAGAQALVATVDIPVAGDGVLPDNGGLEALAVVSGATLLAGGEAPTLSGAHPVWAWPAFDPKDAKRAAAGAAAPVFGIATPGVGFGLTGMDAGPDGTVYLLFRRWVPSVGNTIVVAALTRGRIEAALAHAGGAAAPVVAPRLLARFAPDGPLPMDNFEGISVDATPGGPTRLWIVSDDNFRRQQRTLLYGFTL